MTAIPKTMRACVMDAVGHTTTVEMPVPEPAADEVLCRIRGIAICGTDPEILHGERKMLNWPPHMPFVLGHEWSGEVVAVGKDVAELKAGDRVAGEGHCGCGQCENCMRGHYTICLNYNKKHTGHRHYGFVDRGANAEYNTYRAKSLTKIPDSLPFAAATLCDTAGVALHGIELVGITPGGTTVIYGPGPIGLCALGIAKAMGADRVIMVGRRYRLEVARALGADICIDFEKEDPVARIRELTGGKGADEVLECSGAPVTVPQSINSVRKGGKVSLIGFYDDTKIPLIPMSKIVNEEIHVVGSKANPNVSAAVIRMLAKGVIGWDKIVTHRMPLDKYAEAMDIFVNRKDNVVKMVIEP